jgi:DNA-directed RNA polymerase specialized sigma subunit
MTNSEIKDYQKRARNVACGFGLRDDADDFAQEAIIQQLSGRKATLKQLCIDYIREKYGRTGAHGSVKSTARADARTNTVSIDQPVRSDSETRLHDIIRSDDRDPESLGHAWRDRHHANGVRGLICDLYFDQDMRLEEIAELLGVTGSRISQLMRQVKAKISDCALIAEKYSEYCDDKDYSKIVVNWITI